MSIPTGHGLSETSQSQGLVRDSRVGLEALWKNGPGMSVSMAGALKAWPPLDVTPLMVVVDPVDLMMNTCIEGSVKRADGRVSCLKVVCLSFEDREKCRAKMRMIQGWGAGMNTPACQPGQNGALKLE